MAVQGDCERIRPQLRHSGRTDGRRALQGYGTEAAHRRGESVVVGHTVCDDAHLQPSVVLAHVGVHMAAYTACRRAHGIGDGCHDGVLRARTVVLHIMLPHRYGVKTDKPHTPHADAEKENGSLRRAQP